MDVLCNTNNLTSGNRFEYWHQTVCNTFAQVYSDTEHAKNYSGYIKSRRFGELTLTETAGQKVQFERTRSHICTDPREEIQLLVLLDGHFSVIQHGNAQCIRPGDIVLYDSTQPYQLELDNFHSLTTIIPKSIVTTHDIGGKILKRESLATSIISKTITDMGNEQLQSTIALQKQITQNLIDLICANLHVEAGDTNTTVKMNSKVQRIKQYLATQLSNPDASIDMIANAMSMSPRTLHRLFLTEGETVMGWLWKARLTEIHKQLETGRFVRVGDAALEYGFSDFSHFSRSFKKHFGYTPTTLLKK